MLENGFLSLCPSPTLAPKLHGADLVPPFGDAEDAPPPLADPPPIMSGLRQTELNNPTHSRETVMLSAVVSLVAQKACPPRALEVGQALRVFSLDGGGSRKAKLRAVVAAVALPMHFSRSGARPPKLR